MSEWSWYRRVSMVELRPYVPGEDMEGISISKADITNGSPKKGDMIARAQDNYADQWLVNERYFKDHYYKKVD